MPSPDAIRAMYEERTGKAAPTLNGVTLGPKSPLITQPRDASGRKRTGRAIEHAIQVAFFVKVNDPENQLRWPELALVHAIPNFFGASKATKAQGGRAKAEGRKPGVPDVHCPVARGGYHSFWIEFKKPGGTTSPEQAHWLSALAREGHKVALHTNEDVAFEELITYLSQPR
jgi:hypothetical protein